MSARLLPAYQDVDGVRIALSFSPDAFRSGLQYKARPGELFISSYPKTGTTWTQMIAMLIRNRGKPPSSLVDFYRQSPFLDMHGAEAAENNPNIVAIKIHFPLEAFPLSDQAKYIYVTRNPKDTCISFFHHSKTTLYLFDDGEFDVFFDLFMEGKTDYGDYFDHMLDWYRIRDQPNVLFLTYEELKKDTRSCVLKMAKFMGEEDAKAFEDDPGLMDKVLEYSGIQHMKKLLNSGMEEVVGNLSVTVKDLEAMVMPAGMKYARKFVLEHRTPSSKVLHLVRKGMVGDWKNVFTPEQVKRMDEKIEKRMAGTELLEFWKKENCV